MKILIRDGIFEWIEKVDEFFEKQTKLVAKRLMGKAENWWKQFQEDRSYEGKNIIMSWEKKKLNAS